MGEGVKTVIFALIAFAVAVAAVVSRPKQDEWDPTSKVGTNVFEKFDGNDAAGIKVVKYDEELGQVSEFEVARDKKSGAWVIPSNAGYPADAEDRIRDATLMLDELEILDVASEIRGDHELFGVISPGADEVEVGDEGVGLLLTFQDDKDQNLASLIIGHTVKDKEGQRFVRDPSLDAVYVVEIDPDKLSTKFEDWIEKDLLQLSSFDIEDVAIKNYTVDLAATPPIQRNFDFDAEYKDAKWNLAELTRYSNNQPIAGALGPDEELDKEKLNDLKSAVDNLEIVDVFRKPEGLGRDLKAGEDFKEIRGGENDLAKRGYYVTRDTRELLSANGEVRVGMKDGVEYVLRFGETLAGTSDDEAVGAEGTEEPEATEEKKNRYLFAMARVDMSKLPAPELEDVPELPEGAAAEPPAGEAKDTDDSSKATEAESTSADEAEATETTEAETSESEDAAEESAEADAKDAGAEEETADAEDAAKTEPAEGDAKDSEDADAEDDKEAKEAEIMKERERITKENERKLNEYNEKVHEAKKKVAELNTRFGDWYYVVSDEQCQKIFLGLDELITKKESETVEGDGVDAFRDLQDKGLKKDEDEDSTP